MTAAAAWAVTALCIIVVVACMFELFVRRRSSLRRVAIVMGVTLAIDIAVSQFVPWAVMWLPLMASHLVAAIVVLMRPANRTHVVIGVLYAIAAAFDLVFALHGDKAITWSLYMDMINFITIAQAGALLTGVLSNGDTGRRRVSSSVRDNHIQSPSSLGNAG